MVMSETDEVLNNLDDYEEYRIKKIIIMPMKRLGVSTLNGWEEEDRSTKKY